MPRRMATTGRIVIAAYRPKPGKVEELRRLIVDHVATLRAQKLVTDREPITMEAQDGTIVEVFEWVSKEAIEAAHSNPAVLAMWQAYGEVCDYIPVGQVPEAAQIFSELTPVVVPPVKRPPSRRPDPPALPPRRPPITPPRNQFGDPKDTLYAGGTPRFDETGGLAPRKRRR